MTFEKHGKSAPNQRYRLQWAYLTSETIICATNWTKEIVDIIIVYAPSRTVGRFAVEGVVSRIIFRLGDGFGEVLLINFRRNELHASVAPADKYSVICIVFRKLDVADLPPWFRVLEGSIRTYTRCLCTGTSLPPPRNKELYSQCTPWNYYLAVLKFRSTLMKYLNEQTTIVISSCDVQGNVLSWD